MPDTYTFSTNAGVTVEREKLIAYLKDNGIGSVFHYIPLHTSLAGEVFGYFYGDDSFTSNDSERILRLPMFYGLDNDSVMFVVRSIFDFYENE